MITLHDVCTSYTITDSHRITALDNINLTLNKSEFTAVIGPNGSGKSTMALCLAGLREIDSGKIECDGTNITTLIENNTIHDCIGMVFQDPDDQIVTNNVDSEIAFSLENKGVPYDEMVEIVNDQLKKFGLEEYRNSSPNILSGGQKQKLAVAASLVANPDWLILDEPTSYLDPLSRKNLFKDIKSEFDSRKDSGFSVVFITQFAREAAACDRLIVMDKGEVLADGNPGDIFLNRQEDLLQAGIPVPVEYRVWKEVPEFRVETELFGY